MVDMISSSASVLTIIITFWTGTLFVIYEMMANSLGATLFMYTLGLIFLVGFYNMFRYRKVVA